MGHPDIDTAMGPPIGDWFGLLASDVTPFGGHTRLDEGLVADTDAAVAAIVTRTACGDGLPCGKHAGGPSQALQGAIHVRHRDGIACDGVPCWRISARG
jgi:hypothetical protein